MSETPKNDIEKLLSDYAEQRRNAAGTPELHPATRRILQAEVRHQFPASGEIETLPRRSGWSLLWPRIAVACGVLAAVAVVVVMVNPPGGNSRRMEMALKEEASSEPAPPATLSPAASATPEAGVAVSDRSGRTSAVATKGASGLEVEVRGGGFDVSTAGDVGNKPEAVPFSPVPPVNAEERNGTAGDTSVAGMGGQTSGGLGRGGRATRAADNSATAQPVLAAAAPRSEMTKAGTPGGSLAATAPMSKSAANGPTVETDQFLNNSMTQRYRNVAIIEPRTAVTNAAVLDEFTVEQNGNEMKIVDRDGSVYSGTISNLVTDGLIASDIVATPYAAPAQSAVAGTSESAATLQAGNAPRLVQQYGGGGRGGGGGGFGGGGGGGVQAQNFNEQQTNVFRVEGTNRRLQQRVVFTGNMIQNSLVNSSQNNLSNFYNTQQFRQQNQAQQAPGMNNLNLQMPNNFINGRVVLDDGKMSTEINAMPVDP